MRREVRSGRARDQQSAAALPRPKRPTEFCLVPELPLGATGKVSRRRLRELAMAAG